MYSFNSELCRLPSKSCCSNSTRRPRSCHSSHRTCVDRCDVNSIGSCTTLRSTGNHTVEIREENVVNIDLPPLMWFGYNKTPKLLSATNTGRTVLINGQWACGRPYITGGPLNGSYIFSQIHFHSPSEHEIDGRRYPLEMHVVHYKNSYLTQERAMKERDGTVVLVYLFQLINCGATIVSQISKLASCLEIKNARKELSKFPLDQFVKPFNANYYTYRSLVPTDKNSYLLQWIISCNHLCVTRQEVEELLPIMTSSDSMGHLTMQPEDDVVFRVGEEDYCEWISNSQMTENPCCDQKRVQSETSICEKPSKKSVCKKSSKKSVCKKSSKKSLREKPSKTSVSKKSSKKSVSKRSSKTSVNKKSSKISNKEKSSEKCVRKESSKTSVNKNSSKISNKEKSSEKCVGKKSSKTSVNKKSSKTTANKKSSKTTANKKSSKTSANKKSSKTSANKKSSETSVCEKPSETSVCEKPSETSVCEKPSETSVCEKPYKTSVCEKPYKTSVCVKPSKTSANKKSSETSVCEKPSKTSVDEKSSETSCASVKEEKTKKRDRSESVKVDNATNTTPSCSKSDVKQKKQKGNKPKDVHVTKEKSKSKSMEKCSSQGGTSQTNVKQTTKSASKENAGKKKSTKKSTESKATKMKGKKSSGDTQEKCAETDASKSTEKLDCSEANVKRGGKSSEKIKTLYVKKQKAKVNSPSQKEKAVKTKLECVQPPEPSCNIECSNTTENIECTEIGDNIESNDDTCDDVQINYLFVPNPSSSVHSNAGNVESVTTGQKIKESLRTRRNTRESKDCVKLSSEPIVNHALVKAVKFPIVKSGQSKPVYLHTKHIFRTEGNSRDFTPHTFQECQMLIERDHNVLQEYSGTFYPNQLSPGIYEQVNLLSRYPEPEDLKIHATECIAKLESLHELSIRSKFLISEVNFAGQTSETLSTHKNSEDSIQKMKSFSDAQCQCEEPGSTSVAIDTNFLQEEVNSPCKSLIKWDVQSMGVKSLDFKNTQIVNWENLIWEEVDSRTRNEDKNLKKAFIEQNGAVKLLKNSNSSGPESEITSKESLEQKNEREPGKVLTENSSIKSLKNSSGKRKKTTYFVYDRIENDESTGKKIFIGSFRTRDEVEVLFKQRSTLQSDEISSDLSGRQGNNPSLNSGSEIRENASAKFIKVEDSQAVHKESTSKDESKQLEVITLHKFEPKHYHLRSARINSKNVIVGKISSKVDTDSEKYSQLAAILGIDKTHHPKISFYEFQESDPRNVNNVSLENNSDFDVMKAVENSEEIDKDKVFPSTLKGSDSLDGGYSEVWEGTSSLEKRSQSSVRKDSQSSVVVIPTEAESLSKVEIVLINHTDDVDKQKVENKYTSYLKRYKRLTLKLKFSFLHL